VPSRRPQHLALIGDIVDSRSIPQRAAFQERLRGEFAAIGRDGGLVSPFTLTLGDEFQALYAAPDGLFSHWLRVREAIHPAVARFSIAIGSIDTTINPEQALGMDGPAFHRARAGIEQLKSGDETLALQAPAFPAIAAPLVALLDAESARWKPSRLAILRGLLEGRRAADLAASLDITERAVHKSIRAARLERWVELLRETDTLLAKLLR